MCRKSFASFSMAVVLTCLAATVWASEAASVAVKLQSETVRPGGRVGAEVVLSPAGGVKLYRKSIKIKLSGPGRQTLGVFSFPVGTKVYDPALQEEVEYYKEPVRVTVPILISRQQAEGRLRFTLKVEYQGCSEAVCFPPANKEFELTVRVSATASAPREAVTVSNARSRKPSGYRALLEQGGLLAILGSFLAGLLVSFTPCIYPMIPVTVAVIGAAAGDSGTRKRSVLLLYTLVYVLGIAITYSILGIVATSTQRAVGSLANSPWVLSVVAAVMVALALSMFGAFDLALPSSITNRLGKLRAGGSLPMLFVTGAVMGLVASPCASAPLLAVLAVVGKTGSLALGGVSLFAFAWGMSALLIVAGLFPGLMHRPGPWMAQVKTAMGVVMAALSLYFIKDLVPRVLFGWSGLISALVVGLALTLVAKYLTEGSRKRGLVGGLGGVSLVVACYLLLGFAVRGGGLQTALEYVLPAKVWSRAPEKDRSEVHWQPYNVKAFEQAALQGKPIVIDFYASWCNQCKGLDRVLFSGPEIVAEMKRFALLRVNGTDSANDTALAAKKRFSGNYPTVIVFDSSGKEMARYLGDVRRREFLTRLRTTR
jgi:thioredoxin:protein disulfide reductase